MDNALSIDLTQDLARLPPNLPHEPIVNDPTKAKIHRAIDPKDYPCDLVAMLR